MGEVVPFDRNGELDNDTVAENMRSLANDKPFEDGKPSLAMKLADIVRRVTTVYGEFPPDAARTESVETVETDGETCEVFDLGARREWRKSHPKL